MNILDDQLSELNLGFNSFQTLPASIFGLKCLTTLDLRNNQLTTLPFEIGKLDTLRELILSNNRQDFYFKICMFFLCRFLYF